MRRSELEPIIEESTRRLLQISIPPVRYFIYWDVMSESREDSSIQKALKECETYPPRVKLLQSLQADGTWPISRMRRLAEERGPGPPVGWTYITMLRNLFTLSEFNAGKDEGHIQACVEKILSWQTEEGYIPGPWTDAYPLPHYNGYALRGLLHFGEETDPRIKKLVRWLLKVQRKDGGWLIPYEQDLRYLPQYRQMRVADFQNLIRNGEIADYDPSQHDLIPSCIWSTMMVVRGFVQSDDLPRSKAVRRGAEFFLDRFFKKNYHYSFYHSASNWTKLRYPTYFGSGLCALDLLTWMGFGAEDPRMEKPIKWILGCRQSDGLWSQSERPHPVKDQWISVIALGILSRYARTL
jgi:hypothetical protein